MNLLNHHNPDSSCTPSIGRVLQTDSLHGSVRQSSNATGATRGKDDVKKKQKIGWVRNCRVDKDVLRSLRCNHVLSFFTRI